jgi:hypothetical protein
MIGKILPKFSLDLTGSNLSHINPAKENFKNLNNRVNLCEFGQIWSKSFNEFDSNLNSVLIRFPNLGLKFAFGQKRIQKN